VRRANASFPVRLGAAAGLVALAIAGAPAAAPTEEVRLHLALSSRPHGTRAEREALRDLQYEIAGRLEAARAGKVARDEWPDGWCVIFVAAPDAAAAWAVAEEAVRAYGPRSGSYVVLRRGGRASEQKVPL
jgi:hypothetical protein